MIDDIMGSLAHPRVIYKYPLDIQQAAVDPTGGQGGVLKVRMHAGALVRSVGLQLTEIYAWAEVDPQEPVVDHEFLVVGTGFEISTDPSVLDRYIGTVLVGMLVWHFYQRLRQRHPSCNPVS